MSHGFARGSIRSVPKPVAALVSPLTEQMEPPVEVLALVGDWPPKRSPRALQNALQLAKMPWNGRLYVQHDRDGQEPAPQLLQLRTRTLPMLEAERLHNMARRLGFQTNKMPDQLVLWAMASAITAALTGDARRAQLLMTISSPLSTHLGGLLLKRRYPKLKWLAFFSDPWTEWGDADFGVRLPRERSFNLWLQKKVLENVDAAAFPSKELAEHYLTHNPCLESKRVEIIPQAYDPDAFPDPQTKSSKETLLIRYLGNFYGPRNPRIFLAAVERLQKSHPKDSSRLRFELYGNWSDEAKKSECEDVMKRIGNVVYRGPVPFARARALMASSDWLMHLGVPTRETYFRPSKLVEYLGAQKPILALCSPGAERSFVEAANGVWGNVHDVQHMSAALHQLAICKDRNQFQPSIDFRRQFMINSVRTQVDQVTQSMVTISATKTPTSSQSSCVRGTE